MDKYSVYDKNNRENVAVFFDDEGAVLFISINNDIKDQNLTDLQMIQRQEIVDKSIELRGKHKDDNVFLNEFVKYIVGKGVKGAISATAIAAGLGSIQKTFFAVTLNYGKWGLRAITMGTKTVLSAPLKVASSVIGSIIVDMIFPDPAY